MPLFQILNSYDVNYNSLNIARGIKKISASFVENSKHAQAQAQALKLKVNLKLI